MDRVQMQFVRRHWPASAKPVLVSGIMLAQLQLL
jgi:hypothetical protein